MLALPSGTITFLFTDIEGSTRLWDEAAEAMSPALLRHEEILRQAADAHRGYVFKTIGDAFCIAFADAVDALAAAVAAQRALAIEPWIAFGPDFTRLGVRMALHTGGAEERSGDYFGPALNRTARLMAAAHGGQVLLSLTSQELVRDTLPTGLSLRDMGDRRLKDLRRPERVFQLLAEDLPADFPPLATLDARPNNLPIQLTSFVGREREIGEVRRLLAASRLVTLTGVGGTGKTRLALEAVADLIDDFDHGVWFVDLSPVTDGGLVGHTVAACLGVREEPGRTIEATLAEHLRERRLLVVLDNCEQVVVACAWLAESLLGESPGLRLLATSREVLAIGGEVVWPVPMMTAPDPAQLPPTDTEVRDLLQFEAVRLFVDRAVAVRPEFRLTRENAPKVAEICHRLDGIPLAIELAAARVKLLSPGQIEQRLGERFRLLNGGSRTTMPRQQTLRATMDWSYDLLDAAERALFRHLAVFRGGWTLQAAEAVCADAGLVDDDSPSAALPPDGILDVMSRLVDKSLVVVGETMAPAGRPAERRYRYVETVRQYAWERLVASGRAESVEVAHLGFFLLQAEGAERGLRGPDQAELLASLDPELDNLRAAIDKALCTGNTARALRLGAALWRFWMVRGYLSEGQAWLARALALEWREAEAQTRAAVLNGFGALACLAGDYEAARAQLTESVSLNRRIGNEGGLTSALGLLGNVVFCQGDYEIAKGLYKESIESSRSLGDEHGVAASYGNLGVVAIEQGEWAEARAYLEQALSIHRRLGNLAGVSATLGNLANVAMVQGDYTTARAINIESLDIDRRLGNQVGIAATLGNLSSIAFAFEDYATARALQEESWSIEVELGNVRGIADSLNELGKILAALKDDSAAETYCRESLVLQRDIGNVVGVGLSLETMAWLAASCGKPKRAATMLGSAQSIRETLEATRLTEADQQSHDHAIAVCRSALGDEDFEAAWVFGQAMTLDEAVALALADDVVPAAGL